MIRLLPILLLAACSASGDPGTPVFHDWSNGWSGYSSGAFSGVKPNGSFTFPTDGHIDYVLKATHPRVGTFPYTVSGTGDFATYQNDSRKDCYHGPTVRMMFTMSGDNDLAGRYWQRQGQPLLLGKGTITVTADPADWSDVNGQPGTANPHFAEQFAAAGEFGFSFGDDCAFGHGVYSTIPSNWMESGL